MEFHRNRKQAVCQGLEVTATWLSGLLKWGENVLELDSGAGCTASHMKHAAWINRALCIPHS